MGRPELVEELMWTLACIMGRKSPFEKKVIVFGPSIIQYGDTTILYDPTPCGRKAVE